MSTEKSRPIEGYRQPQESDKDKPVDPKKFDEEMKKVQESGASEQRKKRNLKKSEEGEDEEGIEATPSLTSPGDAFKLTMEDGDEAENALAIQDPSNAKGLSAAPSSGKIIEFDEVSSSKPQSQKPPEEPLKSQETSSPQTPSTSDPNLPSPSALEEPSTAPFTSPEMPPQNQDQDTSIEETPQASKGEDDYEDISPSQKESSEPQKAGASDSKETSKTHKKKKKKEDTSLIKKQKPSFDKYLREKKNKPMKDLKFEEAPKTPLEKKENKKQKTSQTKKISKEIDQQKDQIIAPKAQGAVAKTPQKQLEPEDKSRLGSQEITKTSSTSTHLKDIKAKTDHKKDESKEDKTNEELQVQSDLQSNPNMAPTPPQETQAASKLHPQVFELFEKMVGLITVEQHRNAPVTTVTVAMKGSVFDGAKIILEHTGAKAFNLQLQGSPKALELFNDNISDLASAFASSKYNFDVNIRKPTLLKEHRALEKKGKVTRKKDHGSKN